MLKVGTLLRDIQGGAVSDINGTTAEGKVAPGSLALVAAVDGPPDNEVTLIHIAYGWRSEWGLDDILEEENWEIVETPDE